MRDYRTPFGPLQVPTGDLFAVFEAVYLPVVSTTRLSEFKGFPSAQAPPFWDFRGVSSALGPGTSLMRLLRWFTDQVSLLCYQSSGVYLRDGCCPKSGPKVFPSSVELNACENS